MRGLNLVSRLQSGRVEPQASGLNVVSTGYPGRAEPRSVVSTWSPHATQDVLGHNWWSPKNLKHRLRRRYLS